MSHNLTPVAAEVDQIYAILAQRQEEYLTLHGQLQEAKFDRDRAVDAAYAAGGVLGKNEREREANLRQDLADYYQRVDQLEGSLRLAERAYRDAQVSAECVKLKVLVLTANHL